MGYYYIYKKILLLLSHGHLISCSNLMIYKASPMDDRSRFIYCLQ